MQKLLDVWRKGQTHFDMFWKLLFDEYVLNLREGTEKHLRAPRKQSSAQPTEGDVLLVKENSPRGTWNLAVSSTGGEIKAATVHKAQCRKGAKPYAQLSVPPGMCCTKRDPSQA